MDTTSNSNNLTIVQSENANVDISHDVKSSDYNIDENINDKNLENSYDNLEEVADKNKNVIGASVDDKEILRADGTLTLVSSGDGYVNLRWTGVTMLSSDSEVTIYRNNAVYGTTTYGTVSSSSGARVNLVSGSNTIYFKGSALWGSYTSSEYTTTYGGGSGGSGDDPIDDPAQLPDYYIRLFDWDEYGGGSNPGEIWKGVQYYSGDSVGFNFVVEIFRGDGGTNFNSVAYSYNSGNPVHLYIDGTDVTSGYSYYLWRNGTSSPTAYSGHLISTTISGVGVHKLYATYSGRDGVTYYSNPYYVYMGKSSGSEYDTTLKLYDKDNPNNSTVYKDVGDTVTIYDLLTASGLSNVTDYVNARHGSGSASYILENLDVYLNGELIYEHTETINYTQNGEGVRVGTADAPNNGFAHILNETGWYNFTAVYHGNNLGLKGTTSNVLHIYATPDLTPTSISLRINTGNANTTSSTKTTVTVNYGGYITLIPKINTSSSFRYLVFKNTSSTRIISTTSSYFSQPVYENLTYYVEFEGNATHSASRSNEVSVVVVYPTRATTTTVTASPNPVDKGSTVTITPTVKYSSTTVTWGNVEIYLNNVAVKNITAGQTWDVSASVIGTNNVTAKYLGAVNGGYDYTASQGTTTFVVNNNEIATTTTVSVVNPTISIGASTNVDITVSANGNTITDGNVQVYIDGVAVQTISGRTYTFTTPYSNTAKTYTITAKYLGATVGNVIYSESTSNSDTVTVKDGLVITVTANPIYYGDQAVVNIVVSDSNGPVDGITVSISTPSGTESKTTDSNGWIVYTITDVLNADTYTITASYGGGSAYESSNGQGNLIVNKLGTVIESSDFNTYALSGENMVLYLKDSKGNSLGSGKTVSIQFNNDVQTLTTDANGTVKIPINVAKGTYTVSASFADETNYNSSFATFKVNVKPNPTVIEVSPLTYSKSAEKNLVASLKDGNGQAIEGKTLNFYINGKVYSGTSDANGQVSIPVVLNVKKTYQVVVRYDGDNNYEKSYNKFNLKVTS